MAKDIWDKKDIMHINDTDYDEKLIDHLKTFWIPELTKLKIMKLTTKSNHTKVIEQFEDRINAMVLQWKSNMLSINILQIWPRSLHIVVNNHMEQVQSRKIYFWQCRQNLKKPFPRKSGQCRIIYPKSWTKVVEIQVTITPKFTVVVQGKDNWLADTMIRPIAGSGTMAAAAAISNSVGNVVETRTILQCNTCRLLLR